MATDPNNGGFIDQTDTHAIADPASDRDAALARVQGYYDQAGFTPNQSDLNSSVDNELKYGTDGPDGGERANILARATNTPNSDGSSGGGSPYSSGSGNGGGGFGDLMSYLQSQQSAQNTQQQGLRDMLMSQMGDLSKPVDENSPGVSGVLAGERLQSARGAQASRGMLAEQMANDGLSSSGALSSGVEGIDQQRSEKDAQFTGSTLYNEMNTRRSELQGLLTNALQLGDAESARTLQAQIAALTAQQQNSQFGQSLAAQQQNFGDSLGYNYAALMGNLNSGAYSSAVGMF